MRASHYAKALAALVLEHPKREDELVERTFEVMRENGQAHLAKKVLRSFTRLHEREAKKTTIEVISAHPINEDAVATLLKKGTFSKLLSTKHKRVVRKIDDTLIGGVIVQTGSLRVDQSYKRALIELYQRVTK